MSDDKEKSTNDKVDKKQDPPVDHIVSTQHVITVNGQEIRYTATTGTMVIHEEKDKKGSEPKTQIFFVAYTKDDSKPADRPLTFSFNGGPGSSSVWLHLGVLGPRRVPLDENDGVPPLPYQLQDNEYTLLAASDLVFIDPTGTGYSRAVEGEEAKQFYNYKKDIETVGEFIRLYTSRYGRWSSSKFLIGESYGTTRASALSGYLQNRHGMYLNGIMLVSVILNFQTARFQPGNDLPYPLFLPTYAATAWYHQLLAPAYQALELEAFLAEVRAFAENEYTLALMQGAKLSSEKRADVVQLLAAYTGLSIDYIERTDLRIGIHRFVKEILRAEGRTVGRFDSRIIGFDRDEVGERHEHDPSFATVHGVYSACLNQYVREELEFESDLPYEILSFDVFPSWNYEKFQNEYVNTAEILRASMTRNPHLKVFVANGLYDLATPFFATEYTMNHLALKPHLQGNISMGYYEAGHMMYTHEPSLIKLSADLINFVLGSS